MKTIIAGSRALPGDEEKVWYVSDAVHQSGWLYEITEIVSGGARGIDLAGEQFANDYGIPIKRFVPDWDRLGKAAGIIRNGEMAAYADALILVWDGRSTGSANMKKQAIDNKLKVFEYIVK